MTASLPMPLNGMHPSASAGLPAPAPLPGIDGHRVRFTGSGGDYFQLWLSNLLLTIVTLGIYTPWARRRRIQYFFRNTEVGNDPMDFTASSRSMVTSFVMVALAYGLVQVLSSQGLNTAVGGITLLIAIATPWLWRSAMRFRIGNTTWRGLPFVFHATTRETYIAAWPLLGGALFIALAALLLPNAPTVSALKVPVPGPLVWLGLLGLMVLAGAILIRLRFNFLHLKMTRTSLGGHMGAFKAGFGEFFKVGAICIGIGLLAYLALAALLGIFSASLVGFGRSMGGGGMAVLIVLMFLFFIPLLLLPASITLAAWEAMLFRTVWNHTGLANMARSKCSLKTSAFVLLRTKNVLLTLVTLGFYRPFATVSEYRLKLDSIQIYTRGDIDALSNAMARNHKSGLGDAAADLAGFDLAV